ncbi:hypothetical protein PCYB_143350 [Plasmodium cynomolgi strain B]|uniref:Uncharacterized protein n=1 Tax=Plasmodium cynomolgi (strain B) TaxID=1120755 RepID=K6VHR5_PLACD|nr:hypothetical protein PCYB_143350 [Plasmodium cynomolgi strain B]GAB68907.1 hypothetical protein PCYB_143350 [Plasmodium cynomolgi strain B]
MSKSVRRGEIYFNGVFKYYKKKSLPVRDDAGYGDISTERGYLRAIREKNSTHKIGRKREKVNHAEEDLDWDEDVGPEIDKMSEADETDQEREDEQEEEYEKELEEERGHKPERLQKRGEKPREQPRERSREQNKGPPKLTAITSDAVEAPVRRLFPDGILKKRNRSYIKRSKKKINGENCKHKYELPTIASLGKVKKLNYLNFEINEDEMTKQERMLLDNLSNVCFGSSVLHTVAQPRKKLRRKKGKPCP